MKPLKLYHPIQTLDGKELFAAGSVLSDETIQEARKKYPPPNATHYSLFKHGSVFSDMQDLMTQQRYSIIFSDADERKSILQLMTGSRVQAIVLDALDYFLRCDINTYHHGLMVFALSLLLTRRLRVPNRNLEQEILMSGPTHDLGKICIPLPILSKSTPLTVTENQHLKEHTTAGYALLSWHNGNEHVCAARIARDHHERSDGTGYPKGKKLSDILVEIIAACDIYDALISPRPYRSASFDNRTALEELTELAEKNYLNRKVLQTLVALNRHNRPKANTCVVSQERRGTPPADNHYGVTVDDTEPNTSACK